MSVGMKSIDRFKTILRALERNYRVAPGIFILLILTNAIVALLSYIPGIISKAVLNMLQAGESYEKIIYVIAFTIPAALFIKAADALSSILSLRQNDVFEQYINEEILEKNSKLDISCYDTPKYYNTISDLTRSKRAFNRLKRQSMNFLAATLNFIINVTIITYYSSFIYVLIMLVFIIPAVLLSSKYELQMDQYEIDNMNTMRKISYYAGVLTGRTSAQEIRFYNLSDYFINRYEDIMLEYRDGIKKINRRYGIINSFAKVLPGLGTGIVLIVSAINVVKGNMMIGDFVFLISAVSELQVHFTQIALRLSRSDVNCHAVNKYEDYLALPEIINKGKKLLDGIDSIEFRNVTFKYPFSDETVLDHVDFTIDPHKKTALVGVNGAGKTTIAKLLMHFYDVDDGAILINGTDIREYELVSLRSRIASVFQNYSIYSLSLGFNITLSFEHENVRERMKEALCNAGLSEFLSSIDNNFDKELSKRFSNDGVILSGGQNQRIAIARSLFGDAQYYLLDEPSAALDPIAESQILKQFDKAYNESGLLMITHRLSNTEVMDKIIVIENGRVIENGAHDELIMKNGRYRELFEMQKV